MVGTLAISPGLLDFHSEESFVLTSSQLAFSRSIQELCKESISCSAIAGLAIGRTLGIFTKSQSFHLFSSYFSTSRARLGFSRFGSAAVGFAFEGASFHSISTWGATGSLRLGDWNENLHSALTLALCHGIGKQFSAAGIPIRHLAQNGGIVALDLSFECFGWAERTHRGFFERLCDAEIMSFRMEISAKFLANVCPQVSYIQARWEIEGRVQEKIYKNNKNETFLDLVDQQFATVNGVPNEGVVEYLKSERKKRDGTVWMKDERLSDSIESALTQPFSAADREQVQTEQGLSARLQAIVQEIGIDSYSEYFPHILRALTMRVMQGEAVEQFDLRFGGKLRDIINQRFDMKVQSRLGEQMAFLLAFYTVGTPLPGRPVFVEGNITIERNWGKLVEEARQLLNREEELAKVIQIAERRATVDYYPEIAKLESALGKVKLLVCILDSLKTIFGENTELVERDDSWTPFERLQKERQKRFAYLVYQNFKKDLDRIKEFKLLFKTWRDSAAKEAKLDLEGLGHLLNRDISLSERWQEIWIQKIICRNPFFSAQQAQWSQGGGIELRIIKEVKFNDRHIPEFYDFIIRELRARSFDVMLVEEEDLPPYILWTTPKGRDYSIKVTLV